MAVQRVLSVGLLLVSVALGSVAAGSDDEAGGSRTATERHGPYCGEAPPQDQPVVFAPGFISKPGRMERALVFSPDGTEALFAETSADYRPRLLYTRQVDGRWSEPEPPSFADVGNNTEAAFASDGRRLYFASNRPPGAPPYQFDLWVAEREGDGWGSARRLPEPISSPAAEYHPTISAAGTLCFASTRSGNPDLFCARQSSDGEGLDLPEPVREINTEHQEWDPYLAPDESYLIFKSDRPGGLGEGDGYITFRTPEGGWGEPRLIPPPINTPLGDDVGDISPDGRYLIFSRRRGDEMDVYWVRADVVLGPRRSDAAIEPEGSRRPSPPETNP